MTFSVPGVINAKEYSSATGDKLYQEAEKCKLWSK